MTDRQTDSLFTRRATAIPRHLPRHLTVARREREFIQPERDSESECTTVPPCTAASDRCLDNLTPQFLFFCLDEHDTDGQTGEAISTPSTAHTKDDAA